MRGKTGGEGEGYFQGCGGSAKSHFFIRVVSTLQTVRALAVRLSDELKEVVEWKRR